MRSSMFNTEREILSFVSILSRILPGDRGGAMFFGDRDLEREPPWRPRYRGGDLLRFLPAEDDRKGDRDRLRRALYNNYMCQL